jgi:hypothetical protein
VPQEKRDTRKKASTKIQIFEEKLPPNKQNKTKGPNGASASPDPTPTADRSTLRGGLGAGGDAAFDTLALPIANPLSLSLGLETITITIGIVNQFAGRRKQSNQIYNRTADRHGA